MCAIARFGWRGTRVSSATSAKCVVTNARGPASAASASARTNPQSKPAPSALRVPFPNSSTTRIVRAVAARIARETRSTSRVNVDL